MGKKVAFKMASVNDPKQVLCTLEGLMAIADDWTRNESNYTTPVYEGIEASEEFQEMIANSSFYIGLDHPEKPSRSSIISRLREAAGIVRYYERDIDTGEVNVVVDILDTPFGRIANTLARYGSKLGISTRANGDQDEDGTVVEGSVIWYGADLVTQPSQDKARLRLRLNESRNRTVSKVSQSDLMEALKYVKGKKQFKSVEKSLLEAVNKSQGGSVMAKKVEKKIAKKPMKFKRFGKSGEHLLEGRKILRESSGEDFEVAAIDYNGDSNMLEVTTTDGVLHEFEREVTPESTMVASAPAVIEEEPLIEGEEPEDEVDLDIPVLDETEELEEGFEDTDEIDSMEIPMDNTEDDIDAEDVDTTVPVETEDDLTECELNEGDEFEDDSMEFEELQEGVSVGSDGDADVAGEAITGTPRGTAATAGKMTRTVPKPGYDSKGIKKPDQVEVGNITIGEDGYVMLEGANATKRVRAKVKGRTMKVYVGKDLVEQVTLDRGDNLIECFKTVSKDYKAKLTTSKVPTTRRK